MIVPSQPAYVPPVTGPVGVKVSPQSDVTVGNVTAAAVAAAAHDTVLLLVAAGIVKSLRSIV